MDVNHEDTGKTVLNGRQQKKWIVIPGKLHLLPASRQTSSYMFSSFLFFPSLFISSLFISFGCYAGSPRRPVQINSLAEEFPPLPAQHAVGIADILRAVSPKLPSGKVKMNNFLSLLLKKHSLAPPPPAHAVHPTVLLTCAAMIMSQIPAREYAVVCKVDIYISFFLLVLTYAIKPICTFLHLKILQCRTSIAFWKATR